MTYDSSEIQCISICLSDRVDLRVGRILAAAAHPRARRPAYQLELDFGPLGHRRSSAQLTRTYDAADLPGRLIVAAVNLGARNVAGFVSEVLVLGVPVEHGGVVLLTPEAGCRPGDRVGPR